MLSAIIVHARLACVVAALEKEWETEGELQTTRDKLSPLLSP